MPKKEWTEEERKAFGEKMKAARAKREEKLEAAAKNIESAAPIETISGEPGIDELKAQIAELKAYMFDNMNKEKSSQAGGQVAGGRVVGTFEKYIVDPARYPDPRERLAKEPKLARFAFDDNYELDWDIKTVTYETKDGINTKEPKFQIELYRIIYNDETGEKTSGRYVVCRGTFFEDPQAALVVARENGLEVDEENEKQFLDEMRYLRIRDWLLEAFFTPRPSAKREKKEMVVNGTIVQYFEINSEDGQSIPFNELKKSRL